MYPNVFGLTSISINSATPILRSVKTATLENVITDADGLNLFGGSAEKDGKLSRNELQQYCIGASRQLQTLQSARAYFGQCMGGAYDSWFDSAISGLQSKLTAAAVLAKNFNALSERTADSMGVVRPNNTSISAASIRAVAANDGKSDDVSVDDLKPVQKNDKAQRFVSSLYQNILNRAGEKGGVEGWTKLYTDANDPVEGSKILFRGFFNSAEYAQAKHTPVETLDKLFEICYGRAATTEEKEKWLPKVTASPATALEDLMATSEFKLKQTLNKLSA